MSAESNNTAQTIPSREGKSLSKGDRPPKPKQLNSIDIAVKSWLDGLPEELLDTIMLNLDTLSSTTPKRWTVYPPMVLLPSGSLNSPQWSKILSSISSSQKDSLWTLILQEITRREGKGMLTHLAINSGIPLNKTTLEEEDGENENILRTPSGLIMLYGYFGPDLSPNHEPSVDDFEDAFWVSTKQNGITQVWAPRYTMFSRGNIKEKARLLDFHSQKRTGEGNVSKEEVSKCVAVDLYAGIGYFVFSYVAMGIERVVGWELNP